jgi:glycosyltransferase involved in cell wall biosynthesis
MNILFLVPYPLKESPSQRFRFEQYLGILEREGHSYHVHSFLNDNNWRQFSAPGRLLPKILVLLKGLARRTLVLFAIHNYQMIFVHREIAPIGPPVFEWLISKVLQKKIIYDFDDALWLTDRQNESLLLRLMKWRTKVSAICRWSYKVSCGNEFLCDYARQFNQQVVCNPTTIDTDSLHNRQHVRDKTNGFLTVGWTGSHSTLKYLEPLEPILLKIENAFPSVRFIVIADQEPSLHLQRLIFKPWRIDTEIDDLSQVDIGIMPLPDDEWSKGKCAFKALQYMALEIPTIASRVGANTSVIDHGVNGFLASTPADWEGHLTRLIEDQNLRISIGRKGRERVVDRYSVRSNGARFLSLFA